MERSVNQEQLGALFRTLLQIAGGIFGWAWMDDNMLISLSGVAVTVVATLWGLWARTDKNLVASAAEVPAVRKIVAAPATAEAIPSVKVVAPGGTV